jgi:Fanconi anemia group J protein
LLPISSIHFWHFLEFKAFDSLKTCHSVILCSGTLAPLETFQSELGISFENQLEANHVIAHNQVWVGSIGVGPTNVNLTGNAKNLETLVFQDEIGRIVIDICKVKKTE